jgi:putative membrane protein
MQGNICKESREIRQRREKIEIQCGFLDLAIWRWKMMGGFGMGFMWIFGVAIIVIGFALAWSYYGRGKRNENSVPSALDVLKQRYARGEINKEEYEEKRKDLTQ